MMVLRSLALIVATVFLAGPLQSQQPAQSLFGLEQFNPAGGHWIEDPDAPHTYSQLVRGDAAHGHWIMYVKIDPGAWINWHWHSNPQNMFGVSGTMEYEIRPAPKFTVGPGSFAVVPGHALHNGQCISKEPCTFFIENLLPNDKHMADATGAPLKK